MKDDAPVLAWLYGVRPWEINRLSRGEARRLLRFARRILEERSG